MSNSNTPIPAGFRYLFGGVSGMIATCFVQPLDVLKNRMQMAGEGGVGTKYSGSLAAIRSIVRAEGSLVLYSGLSAGLFRQATYTTARLGAFQTLQEKLSAGGGPLPLWKKILCGMFAGAFGAVFGTPAEVCLIRMATDGRLPVEQRRNYKHVFHALSTIFKTEGWKGLFKGISPTVTRAMILNAVQLSSFEQAKEFLKMNTGLSNPIVLQFFASFISGFLSTVVSMPSDLAKTRLQTQKTQIYSGALDVIKQTVVKEGPFALWKGFMPYFLRLGPHTIITFMVNERFLAYYRKTHQKK
eukprot:TRINITY_DN5954_c0_g1_i1.p1 TRINITY_DN5954_c0_g1~~TRINITY_DN5954_c0_g1_i1.p1  ORF type:complete len:299 (-),score=60.69 TRINITY_DN5954_c0_g1_i1:55-951(-)